MHRYRHILVTADLISNDDDPVAERAKEIAAACQSSVSLLHVVEPFYNYVSPYVVEAISEWQEQTLESAKRKLARVGKKLSIPAERQIVTVGQVRAEILRISEQVVADLILVGSHGRHGLSLFLHGSIASDLISHANCDVLAVSVKAPIKEHASTTSHKHSAQH